MRIVRSILFAVLIALCALPLFVYAYSSPGKPTGFVNDFAHVLTAEQITTLNADLSTYENDTTNEIAVVTLSTLGDETIENYAASLFADWKIGKKEKDNGLLLLVAVNDHQMRIEVGYGLEPYVTDAESSHIISTILRPAFKTNDYYGGISAAVTRMKAVIGGDAEPTEGASSSTSSPFQNWMFVAFFGFMYAASLLGRSKSWWLGGVFGAIFGVVAGFIFGFFYIGLLAIVGLTVFGLLFDFIVSSAYQRNILNGTSHPWWMGGGGFGGSGGGGFGGFGGGSSGGGGASGGW